MWCGAAHNISSVGFGVWVAVVRLVGCSQCPGVGGHDEREVVTDVSFVGEGLGDIGEAAADGCGVRQNVAAVWCGCTVPHMLSTFVGAVAALLTSSRAVPQLVRLWRSVTAEGVPVTATGISAGSTAGWAVYGYAHQLWPLVVSSAFCSMLLAVIAVVLVVRGRVRTSHVVVWAGWGLLLGSAGVVGGAAALASALLVAPVSYAVMLVRDMVRASEFPDLAPGTYLIDAGEGVLWISYAALALQPLMVVNSAIYVAADVFVLVVWWRWHRAEGCVGVPQTAVSGEVVGPADS